jgi:hypothetical protein
VKEEFYNIELQFTRDELVNIINDFTLLIASKAKSQDFMKYNSIWNLHSQLANALDDINNGEFKEYKEE